MSSFVAEAGKGLASEWVRRALAPASIFWLGGLVAWSLRSETTIVDLWPTDSGDQLVTAVILLVIVACSAAVMEAFVPHWLRSAEGYWTGPLSPMRRWLVEKHLKRLDEHRTRWRQLVTREQEFSLSSDEIEEMIELDLRRARLPVRRNDFMPTTVGNFLRAAETYPANRYGLDGVVCWPRLWLLLEKEDREALIGARAQIDQATQLWAWGCLFMLFGVASWWCVAIGLVAAWLSWRLLCFRTLVFAELSCAVFDLRRFALYDALCLPRPENPETEPDRGRLVTRYLFRGVADGLGTFVEQRED